MLERNHYLAEYTSFLPAVYNGICRSSIGDMVRYAQKLGRKIIVIDPSRVSFHAAAAKLE